MLEEIKKVLRDVLGLRDNGGRRRCRPLSCREDGGIVSSDDFNLDGTTSTQTSLVLTTSVVTRI